MRIGCQTVGYGKDVTDELAIKLAYNAGFTALDFSVESEARLGMPDKDFNEYFSGLGKMAFDLGMEVGQTHAPFYTFNTQMADYDAKIEFTKKAIKATALLGSKYTVIHAIKPPLRQFNEYMKETKEINEKFYKALIPTLKEYDVYCAIENLFAGDKNGDIVPSSCSTAEELAEYIDICDERFVCCLDIGHVNVVTQNKGYEHVNYRHMCRMLGDKIKVLHVHDNNGKRDQHLIPYAGSIDWDEVVKSLKSIGYSGNLSLETFYFMQQIKSECLETGMGMMYMAGKRIYDMFMRQI